MKLVNVVPSKREGKKFDAVFETDAGRTKRVSFGAAGSGDFTKHRDEAKRAAYLARHRVTENWEKPDTPGALSRWLLWNKPTLDESIRDFRRRFKI